MAANNKPIFERTPTPGCVVQIVPADTTTKKTLITGATEGTRIDAISICSNDTAAVNLGFYKTVSGTDYYLGYVNVPIGSGYPSVPKVAAMATLAPDLGYLWLANGEILKVAAVATVTTAKVVDVVATAGDY